MQHMKTVQVPAMTKEAVDHTTCDFCGAVLLNSGYEFAEVTLEHNEGTRYPEGGSGEKTKFDCCADCWESKVLPALRALGATPCTEEWEF